MILYGRSVARGCRQAFVVVDMPFMSYQVSPQQALANAGRIMQETGADAPYPVYPVIRLNSILICSKRFL